MTKLSIIICTYNPETAIIKRCLLALKSLQIIGIEYEVILVENNCITSITENSELSLIVEGFNGLQIISENKPGLSNARIAGVNKSTGNWIVFFDDDNEPSEDYLQNTIQLIKNFPYVKIWGPGNVTVDFIGNPESWVKENCKEIFQEKHFADTEFALQKTWCTCYPPGTGMVVEKQLYLKFIDYYHAKQLKTTGRIGNSLLSAEDNQIILTAILNNYPVGTSPVLNLTHIISDKKSTYSYVKRLRFYVKYSIPFAEIEMLPERFMFYKKQLLSESALAILLSKYLIKGLLKRQMREAIFECLLVLGNFCGINLVLKKDNPKWVISFLKLTGINLNE